MGNLVNEIETDESRYRGQSILNIVENMKSDCIDKGVTDFCVFWHASKDDVMYAATHYTNGVIINESRIKATSDYASYNKSTESTLPKFIYYKKMIEELRNILNEEIKPLLNH